jgi:putative DNA primase/helicase
MNKDGVDAFVEGGFGLKGLLGCGHPACRQDIRKLHESLTREEVKTENKVSEPGSKVYLAVSYGEREAAKALGAKWDREAKCWYIEPGSDREKFKRWLPEDVSGPRNATPMSPSDEFADALRSVGALVTGAHPIMDGNKHRIAATGDKGGEKAIFYVAHLDGRPAGYIKNNRTGVQMSWKSSGNGLSAEEKAKLQAEIAGKLQARAEEEKQEHEETAERIGRTMAKLSEVLSPTTYLEAKQIGVHAGILTDREGRKTYVPVYDEDGKVWTMQYIREDGTKRFAKNSRLDGCFHAVGGLEELSKAPAIVIAEGYATACSLCEAVGFSTVAAFNSGNLPPVAKALREKFPDKPIAIAGDNDLHLESQGVNPGKTKALEAARAVSGTCFFPVFAKGEQTADSKDFKDFNDLAAKSVLGKEGLEAQVKAVVSSALEKQGIKNEEAPASQEVTTGFRKARGARR